MRCEIVAVGTELLLGQVIDTNSAWISQQLATVEADYTWATQKLMEITPRHGETRFHQNFRIDELFRQLEVEFTPLAQEKGLKLKFVHSSLAVYSGYRFARWSADSS